MTFDAWDNKPSQDARDGAALRRLREALPDGGRVTLEGPYAEDSWYVDVCPADGAPPFDSLASGHGATIAEAADACRAALERQ